MPTAANAQSTPKSAPQPPADPSALAEATDALNGLDGIAASAALDAVRLRAATKALIARAESGEART